MFKNIPKHWNINPLSFPEISTIIMGQSPSSNTYNDTQEGLPFFQGKADFGDFSPTPRVWCSKPLKISQKDDILLSVRAPVGAINYNTETCCIGRGLAAIRAGKKLLPKYIYYFFKYYEPILKEEGSGAVFSAITKSFVENIRIPVPPTLEEQQEIVDVLDAASEIIRLRTACIESAQSLIPALFQEMFGDVKNNTKNWKLCNLNDLVYIDRKNISVNELKSNAYRYIGLEHIEKDTGKILIDLENNFNVDLKSNKYYFTNEHVLYGKLRPYLNKVALPTCDGVCSTDIFPIMPRKNISNKYFIKYLMSSPYFVQITSLKTSGANLPRIGTKVLELIKVICPDIEIQNQFAAKAQEIEAYIKTQQAELENAKTMFQSLLHYAFMGELTKYLQKSN